MEYVELVKKVLIEKLDLYSSSFFLLDDEERMKIAMNVRYESDTNSHQLLHQVLWHMPNGFYVLRKRIRLQIGTYGNYIDFAKNKKSLVVGNSIGDEQGVFSGYLNEKGDDLICYGLLDMDILRIWEERGLLNTSTNNGKEFLWVGKDHEMALLTVNGKTVCSLP